MPAQLRTAPLAGCVPAEVVPALLAQEGLSLDAWLVQTLAHAASFARAAVSGYRVGAIAMGTPAEGPFGNLYFGANLEIRNEALHNTVHAEQAAVNNAWLHGERGVCLLAVTAAPCGHCRQFLTELTSAGQLEILIARNDSAANDPAVECSSGDDSGANRPRVDGSIGNGSGRNLSYTKHSLAQLLPWDFGPADLGRSERLMARGTPCPLHVTDADPLMQQAVVAASQSYAPYTGNLAGVAVQTVDGQVICGRAAESAAFNPSLPPLLSALSQMALIAPDRWPSIDRVALAEIPTSISQRRSTDSLLKSIAPDVELMYSVALPGCGM